MTSNCHGHGNVTRVYVFRPNWTPQERVLNKNIAIDTPKLESPIVAHSVYINELDIARGEGFDSFLAKPIEMDHIENQVARILAGEQLWEVC